MKIFPDYAIRIVYLQFKITQLILYFIARIASVIRCAGSEHDLSCDPLLYWRRTASHWWQDCQNFRIDD